MNDVPDDGDHHRGGAAWAALRSSAFAIGQAWRWTPGWLIKLIIVQLLAAITPAGQVVVVAWLVRVAADGFAAYLLPLLLLCALIGLSQVLGDLSRMTDQRIRNRLRRRYQDQLMRAIARMSPQQLADEQLSSLIQACRGALFDIGRLVVQVITAVAAVITAVSLCASVWVISPIAGILVVAALLPSLMIFGWQAAMQDRAFVPVARWQRRTDYRVEQLIGQRSATELATLGSGHQVAELADEGQQQADRLIDRILVLLTRGDLVGAATTAGLLAAALAGILAGGAGGAGVSAGILGVLAGLTATRGAGFAYGDLMAIAPKVGAFRRLVGAVPGAADRSDQQVVGDVATMEADDLTVTYPGAVHPALDGFSIRVERGRIIALVGANGAGKTTAVNALLGTVDCDRGTVCIDGTDLAGTTSAGRLAHFGLLTQEFGRYEFTVDQSVRLGRPDGVASEEEVWAALDSAHLADRIRELPDGLHTQLGPQFGGVGLSGGQWQRLALARIYLRGAGIWVLDEPTSAIDAEAEQQIFAELQRTKADRITIVVSHRAWTLKGMDRIYVLDGGRVVEQGGYEELLAARGRFAEIFSEQ
ncbi:ATP-binding cassette domain-containing protein [Microlunatus soli]|uniref:ATP-binding cassette, subfamily B n=1 Tax=Microlunatus soli TaxID=630515 RepID=A0A1H1VYQ9_9ACTN|nr:ABC transporter ATP-binding protein/permease [Microlunatus soli]SDS89386.1 ATP-binding cassette, subfamily B [Microlunatus soli]